MFNEDQKAFMKKHKKKIIFAGCVVGAVVVGVAIGKRMNKDFVALGRALEGQDFVSWNPIDTSMNLESVKSILDANANNGSRFTIFRKGPEPDAYICIFNQDDFVMPELP